jgi:hypothetical protein
MTLIIYCLGSSLEVLIVCASLVTLLPWLPQPSHPIPLHRPDLLENADPSALE